MNNKPDTQNIVEIPYPGRETSGNYRTALSGEVTCPECDHSAVDSISKRLRCCLRDPIDPFRIWGPVVGKKKTCDFAKREAT